MQFQCSKRLPCVRGALRLSVYNIGRLKPAVHSGSFSFTIVLRGRFIKKYGLYSARLHIVIILTIISCFYMKITDFYIKYRTVMLNTVCKL